MNPPSRCAPSGPTRSGRFILGSALVCLLVTFMPSAAGDEEKPAAPSSPPRAVIIAIHDEINDITLVSLKRRVEAARAAGATMVVFELDTPGGLVGSALEICTYIKNITDLRTVAWVRPWAFSAGSMIALSCHEVVMTSASKMGDCAPIVMSPTTGVQELGKTERAKAESPILKEFRDSANRRHYDPLLCESMVRQGNEIWWLENKADGKRVFVLKAEKQRLLEEENSTWRVVEKMLDPVSGEEIAVRQPIVEERDLLTLTQSEAVAFGFAKAIISNERELRSFFGITGQIARMTPNWAENVADALSSPIVRTVLMILIALGAYAEFHAPGTFVGGTVALIALIVFLGAPYLTGLADVWEIMLVALGVILVALEIFVIPGFGIPGILGVLLILVGFIATFVPAEPGPIIVPRMPSTWLGLKTGVQVIFGGLALSIAGMWLLNKFLPHLPGARGLLLMPAGRTPTATRTQACVQQARPEAGYPPGATPAVQLGDAGTTLTILRPAGKARINGRRVDVIAQGQMIDENRPVEVVEVSGVRVVVREIQQA